MKSTVLMLCAIITACSIICFSFACAQAAPPRAGERFVEPSRGISFILPGGGWEAAPGFGDEIASIAGPGRASISIRWESEKADAEQSGVMARAVMDEFPGSRMNAVEWIDIGGKKASVARFEGAERLSGAMILLPFGGGTVRVSCTDEPRSFVSTFLSCRELATSISSASVPTDHSSLSAAIGSVVERARYAWLDGRAGCPGVADEPRRMARIAADAGDAPSARELMRLCAALEGRAELPHGGDEYVGALLKARMLAAEGRRESASAIFRTLSRRSDGIFAALELARIRLEDGDVGEARRIISRVESGRYSDASGSRMLAALRIWLMRMEGDAHGAGVVFESMSREICGPSGAMAAHEFGRTVDSRDPARAAALFEQAIEADRSYVPAYLSLGRALLDSGSPAIDARKRLERLSALAPDSPDMKGLRRRFAAMGAAMK